MASYTMQLSEYIEMWSQESDISVRERIETGRPKLFDFQYPFFDADYKSVFETNFIRKFYTREIGFETEGLFKFQLESWLLINMPYFNKLFESELLKFDPLMNSSMETTSTRNVDKDEQVDLTTNTDATSTNKQNINGTQTDNTFNRQLENNTPDTRLAITTADGRGVIEYASSIKEGTLNNETNTESNMDGSSTDSRDISGNTTTDITELETYVQNRVGKTGSMSYSKMLQEYRESFLRIENKIFEEMQQLFMLVY
jgi:hypothetical protein